jgi:hypothetical protein
MTNTELLVLIPWVIFAGGVTAITFMVITRDGGAGRQSRRRSRPRRR